MLTGLSLFSGAGGMDVGFQRAGIEVLWANDSDKAACETYSANNLGLIEHGDINKLIPDLTKFKGKTDVVFGGPPCQGFSVAGKMDPNDPRSQLVWSFYQVVELIKPRAFVMENVKALACNERFQDFRIKLTDAFKRLGYQTKLVVLTASDFGVPQKRERMFLVGIQGEQTALSAFDYVLNKHRRPAPSVREAIGHLGKPGSTDNDLVCNAVITLASTPILRKSPYAGMLFNGLGRPLNLERPSTTLPASMGGNKTHIIDQNLLENPKGENWIESYHQHLMSGGTPYDWQSAPAHLRRLTANEALILQTFPSNFVCKGGRSTAYRLIGNAVPCLLAETVASTVKDLILNNVDIDDESLRSDLFSAAA